MYVKKRVHKKIVRHLLARAVELQNRKDRKGKAKQIREIYDILAEIESPVYHKSTSIPIFKQLEILMK